jgi:hypothetical protein
MIKPMRFADITVPGWYLEIDPQHQSSKNMYGEKPYGGWFYELTSTGWRDTFGCSACGPFDPDDLFIGPVEIS